MNYKKFPTFLHFLLILLFYVLFTLPFSLLIMRFPEKYKVLGMLIAYVFPMILTIWLTRKTFDRKAKFVWKPEHINLLPFIILGAYSFLIIGEFFTMLLPEPSGYLKEIYDQLNDSMKVLFQDQITGFLMIAIAAPILEETLFRGVILRALLKKYTPWKAIIFSAIAFGIFHLNPWQFIYASVVGIYLGYVYWKTQSLFYPILIHFLLNGTSFIAAQFYNPEQGFTETLSAELKIGFFIWVIIALLFIYFVYNKLENYFASQKPIFYVATGNKHKINEMQSILGKAVQLKSLKDLGHNEELIETGSTLQENARQKMRQISVPYDANVIADDTGLEVEALDNQPGVYSARYAGENATYQENVDKLLKEMEGKENRKARFRTVIAVSDGNKEHFFEGTINGRIADKPQGEGGFGYDAVFIPENYEQSFAEMGTEQKNAISHRAKALEKLKNYFSSKK